jgi:hypothetical protein
MQALSEARLIIGDYARIALIWAAGDNSVMQIAGSGSDYAPLTFVDRPKASLRVVTLAVWGVGAFLLYKAIIERPHEHWVLPPRSCIFCCVQLRRDLGVHVPSGARDDYMLIAARDSCSGDCSVAQETIGCVDSAWRAFRDLSV